jgi:hypothetical protein
MAPKTDADWFINRWYGEHAPRAWFDFFVAQLLTLRNIAAELEPRVILLDYPLQDILKDAIPIHSMRTRNMAL